MLPLGHGLAIGIWCRWLPVPGATGCCFAALLHWSSDPAAVGKLRCVRLPACCTQRFPRSTGGANQDLSIGQSCRCKAHYPPASALLQRCKQCAVTCDQINARIVTGPVRQQAPFTQEQHAAGSHPDWRLTAGISCRRCTAAAWSAADKMCQSGSCIEHAE